MKLKMMLISFLCGLGGLASAAWLHLPIMRQVAGTPAQWVISNSFGGSWPTHSYGRYWALDFKRVEHWQNGWWWLTYDRGVLASAPGRVVWAGYYAWYGKTVMVDHQNGYTTLYAHLNYISVSKNAWVSTHTILGLTGGSGVPGDHNPHLHWELRISGTSQSVDPRPHLGIANLGLGTYHAHVQ